MLQCFHTEKNNIFNCTKYFYTISLSWFCSLTYRVSFFIFYCRMLLIFFPPPLFRIFLAIAETVYFYSKKVIFRILLLSFYLRKKKKKTTCEIHQGCYTYRPTPPGKVGGFWNFQISQGIPRFYPNSGKIREINKKWWWSLNKWRDFVPWRVRIISRKFQFVLEILPKSLGFWNFHYLLLPPAGLHSLFIYF